MIELLSIWAACFFWAMVFFEINRKEYSAMKVIDYYDHGILIILLILLAPLAFYFVMTKTHTDSI